MANFSNSPQSSRSKIAGNVTDGSSLRSGAISCDDESDEGEPPCSSWRPNICTSFPAYFGAEIMTTDEVVDGGPPSEDHLRRGKNLKKWRGGVDGRKTAFRSSFLAVVTLVSVLLCHSVWLCSAENSVAGVEGRNFERGLALSTTNSCDYDCCLSFLDLMENKDSLSVLQSAPRQLRGNARILQSADATVTDPCPTTAAEAEEESSNGLPISVQYILIVILVMFSALFSGLTLGLMSLDPSGLEIVMANADDPRMARAAKAIYPIRQNGNLLLCTLLLGNVGVNSLLSILMADLTSGLVGFLSSTTVIVLFGEIAPQAFCSRYALQVGEKTIPIVKVVMALLYPITKPLSMVLNKVLGHEIGTTYSTSEMAKLIEMHVQRGHFQQDTGAAMTGALRYRGVSVSEAMTPLINTFMLSADERLGFDTVAKIFKTGYSRIPVYEVSKSNVIGLLFVKDLIFLDPEDEIPVKNFVQIFGRGLHIVWPDDKLGEVLKLLKSGRSHMALVRDVNDGDGTMDPFYEIKGIITLEDIIEIILGDEIVDETDVVVDVNDPDSQVQRTDMGEYIDGALSKRDDEDDDENDAQIVGGGIASDRFTSRTSRGIDWEARLRLLDERLVDEHLSPDEVRAVAAHLKTNYSKAVELISDRQLKELLSSVAVTEIPPAESCAMGDGDDGGEENGVPTDSAELLYERGVPSDFCTVVLAGKITVMSGADKFRSDVSNWGVLATRALTEASYVPDFSAWVVTNPNGTGGCRCIKLDKKAFFGAVDNTALEKTGHDVTVVAREREYAESISSKPSASKPVLTTLKSISSSMGQSNGDSERPSSQSQLPEHDLPPSPKQDESARVPDCDNNVPSSPIPLEDDVKPTRPTYVRTTTQKERHSRRSKLLKAFLRAKNKQNDIIE